MPSQHSDLASSRSLYFKLAKLKLLHLLKHDWRRAVCNDTLIFFDFHQRLHRRQNSDTAELRQEDALAQRWDRMLQDRGAISADLVSEFGRIFVAADSEESDWRRGVCLAIVLAIRLATNICASGLLKMKPSRMYANR